MLLTESELCRRNAEYFPQPERRQKLKKSMGAIRQVMGERKRDRISMFYMRREMEEKKHKEEEEQNETI
jgi:large subunit ribosomal protein L47